MTERDRTQRKLRSELKRLKSALDMGHELEVGWLPGYVRHVNGRRLLGEVLGKTIFVYSESKPEALMVLKHEFLEHILTSEFTAPYMRMINTLLSAFEKEMYQRKERIVKRLCEFID